LTPHSSNAIADDGGRNVGGHAAPPAPNDGGAEDSAVPQNKFGMADSEKATSPPLRMIDSGRYVWSVGCPSMLRALMYFSPFVAPGADIRMNLPAGSAISTRSKSGVLSVRIAVPGVIG
jgi:hypothetical protein